MKKKYKLIVIEDAAHAFGSKYRTGFKIGSCKYSLMSVFSFHPVKTLATGEGGVITTNDHSIYLSLLRLRSHGINKLDDKLLNTKFALTNNKIKNPWYGGPPSAPPRIRCRHPWWPVCWLA